MNIKKISYIILAMLLGVLLSFVAHAVIEIFYINSLLEKGISPEPSSLTDKCFLPSWLQITLLLAGLIGGYLLGCFWFRSAYIKRKQDK